MLLFGWLKIARFVEHVIGRQQHFCCSKRICPSASKAAALHDPLAGGWSLLRGVANQDGQWVLPARQATFPGCVEEAGPLEQIVRKIATDAKSEKTARSAPDCLAWRAISRMRAELPAKSPTVGLNWASAIFIGQTKDKGPSESLQCGGNGNDRGTFREQKIPGHYPTCDAAVRQEFGSAWARQPKSARPDAGRGGLGFVAFCLFL